ncbi:hypothetical protein [Nocardia sp. NBC_01327]|uniref:hypothetical protein n=1 Tax=Nocardia sp. NBC_01327 TaxID=2903593 RepID=UPI002E1509B4|nr:hypothetical protein OG326_06655 [Nocardia sp. NBC_01327]
MTTSQDSSETRTGGADFRDIAPADSIVSEPELESAPDVGFNISAAGVVTDGIDPAEQSRQLAHQIARELMSIAPEGWHRVDAAFALTVTGRLSRVIFHDDRQRQARIMPSPEVLSLVTAHREVAAQLGDGPWWRLELSLTAAGELDVDHDYGDDPFPDDQMFAPQDYLADLEAYPRANLPTWLGAYVRHDNRQSRTPKQAAVAARADRDSAVLPTLSEDDFPDFPVLWSRWSAIGAAFAAVGSDWGPRVLPSFGWFEGSRRSGSSLYALPGGRAVLSGGVWAAPELTAAYNGRASLPRLYAGAPEWVANSVLNTRAAGGLLTFCYWWEGGRWYRGESPPAADLAAAVPGIWTAATVTDVIAGLVADAPTAGQRSAVAEFVAAADRGDVTDALLAETFGPAADLDEARYQLTLAGVMRTGPGPLLEAEALAVVRNHPDIASTQGFPLDRLRAERLSVGWLVYVPTEPGAIVLSRALFYVADDGVVESATSATPPSVYLPDFEQRFRRRQTTSWTS